MPRAPQLSAHAASNGVEESGSIEDPRREACENRKGDSSPAVDTWVTRSSITPQRDGPQAGSLGTAQRGQITLQGTKPHESRPKVERPSAR